MLIAMWTPPNLHLIAGDLPRPERDDYYGMDKALIDAELCTECGLCFEHCRFGAIKFDRGYRVDPPFACEGCSVCRLVCPAQAVTLVPAVGGELRLYKKDDVVFSTAQLKMGSGNSGGLLVTEVKTACGARLGEYRWRSSTDRRELAVRFMLL